MVGEDVAKHNDHSAAYYANTDWCSCQQRLNYFPGPASPKNWTLVISFRSNHSGGSHFCLSDGSVKFISASVEISTYRSLCTKNGGEVVTLAE
jgi:hypothetical protein